MKLSVFFLKFFFFLSRSLIDFSHPCNEKQRKNTLWPYFAQFAIRGYAPALDHAKVIDKFATKHSRRMLLVDPVSERQ